MAKLVNGSPVLINAVNGIINYYFIHILYHHHYHHDILNIDHEGLVFLLLLIMIKNVENPECPARMVKFSPNAAEMVFNRHFEYVLTWYILLYSTVYSSH